MAIVEFDKRSSSRLSSPEVAEKLLASRELEALGIRGDTLVVTEYTPLAGEEMK